MTGRGVRRCSPEGGNAIDGNQKLALLQHLGDIPSSVGKVGHPHSYSVCLVVIAIPKKRDTEQMLERRHKRRMVKRDADI